MSAPPNAKATLKRSLTNLAMIQVRQVPEARVKPQAHWGSRTFLMQRKIQWKILRIQLRLWKQPQWKALKMQQTIRDAPPIPTESTAARMTCPPENVEATRHKRRGIMDGRGRGTLSSRTADLPFSPSVGESRGNCSLLSGNRCISHLHRTQDNFYVEWMALRNWLDAQFAS